jgi:hypothetical protein
LGGLASAELREKQAVVGAWNRPRRAEPAGLGRLRSGGERFFGAFTGVKHENTYDFREKTLIFSLHSAAKAL